ncbi:hypothetical protein [Propioniciclava soli]|uniref:hypothetical protein n=1 Tax=Propioniciclava soli TaxID=2775081 RepID=UPI001E462AEB|nr:hypothetical protein [Propioniciclava soli]
MSISTGRRAIAATLTAMTLIAPLTAPAAAAATELSASSTVTTTTATSGISLVPDSARRPTASTVVPGRVALRARDFTVRQVLGFDSGQSPLQPAAGGQYCDTSNNGATGLEPTPLGGRQWSWYATDGSVGTTHVVTAWADGDGALADLAHDTGACRFDTAGVEDYAVTLADHDAFAATYRVGEVHTAVHTVLVRNTLVSVTVDDWTGALDEAAEAQRLAERSAKVVARTRLP